MVCFLMMNVFLMAQGSGFEVTADRTGRVHIRSKNGQERVIRGEPGQRGIESARSAEDGETVGWLVDYPDPDAGSPIAGKLVIVRKGAVVRRFEAEEVFWSWSFYAQGKQVAYHVGPTHGEQASHCELHDVDSGRLLTKWDGDLDDPKRPSWAKGLDH